MIVHNLHIESSAFLETEADAPLVVNSYAPLTFPVALQCLQPVIRWNSKVFDAPRNVKLGKLPERHALNVGEARDASAAEKRSRVAALERLDHQSMLTYSVSNVKRY